MIGITRRTMRGRDWHQLICIAVLVVGGFSYVKAGDKGDDIILSKGKIIMRGGKGKASSGEMISLLTLYMLPKLLNPIGNIIVDPGSGSHGGEMHSMSPIMSLMGHFNPYSFYPMQHHHQPMPQMMIQPIYIEDHGAMHQHQQQYQQHEEPQYQHQQHQEMGGQHQEQQYEPQQEMHHEVEQQQQEPIEHQYEGNQQEEEGGQEQQEGYEQQHPMLAMMMHGSGARPTYQQMAALQAMQQPLFYAQHSANLIQPQLNQQQQQSESYSGADQMSQQQSGPQQVQQASSNDDKQQVAASNSKSQQSNKKAFAFLNKTAANNPFVKIIKPLFKRNKESTTAKPST